MIFFNQIHSPADLTKRNIMKRAVLVLISLVIAGIIVVYLLPSRQKIVESAVISCYVDAPIRLVSDQNRWTSWWPGKKINDSTYNYKKSLYHIQKVLVNGFNATAENGSLLYTVDAEFLAAQNQSTRFNLIAEFSFSANPFKKVIQYIAFLQAKKELTAFREYIQQFFITPEKVYGHPISQQRLVHSSLISAKQTYDHNPSVAEIYTLINEVKQYILLNGSMEMDFPIMNVYAADTTSYQLMVAIATDRDLPSSGKFFLKNMVRQGGVLVTEVKGGMQTIENARKEMEYYMNDNKRSSPAIPYQLLVTDRLKETDSTKWITRIYYPVYK